LKKNWENRQFIEEKRFFNNNVRNKYADILELKAYIYELKEEIEDLEEDNQLLAEKIELLNTAPYIEKIAREELDLIKPNEILYKATKSQ